MPYESIRTIVDGYNLLMTCGFVTPGRIGPGALRAARQKLIGILSRRLNEEEASPTAVVFDTNRESETQIESPDNIKVFFSAGYPDADSMIIEMIRKNSTPKRLLVVSSDHRIQVVAKRREAKFIDSDEWFFEQLGAKDLTEAPPVLPTEDELLKSNQKASSDSETQTWTDLFSDSKQNVESKIENPDSSSEKEGKIWNPFPEDYGDDLLEDE